MSDWQVGDLAVCVDAGPSTFNGRLSNPARYGLLEGRRYRVTGMIIRADSPWQGVHCLLIDDPTFRLGLASIRFRKILPDKHEACEEEFVTLLKRTRRRVSA